MKQLPGESRPTRYEKFTDREGVIRERGNKERGREYKIWHRPKTGGSD